MTKKKKGTQLKNGDLAWLHKLKRFGLHLGIETLSQGSLTNVCFVTWSTLFRGLFSLLMYMLTFWEQKQVIIIANSSWHLWLLKKLGKAVVLDWNSPDPSYYWNPLNEVTDAGDFKATLDYADFLAKQFCILAGKPANTREERWLWASLITNMQLGDDGFKLPDLDMLERFWANSPSHIVYTFCNSTFKLVRQIGSDALQNSTEWEVKKIIGEMKKLLQSLKEEEILNAKDASVSISDLDHKILLIQGWDPKQWGHCMFWEVLAWKFRNERPWIYSGSKDLAFYNKDFTDTKGLVLFSEEDNSGSAGNTLIRDFFAVSRIPVPWIRIVDSFANVHRPSSSEKKPTSSELQERSQHSLGIPPGRQFHPLSFRTPTNDKHKSDKG